MTRQLIIVTLATLLIGSVAFAQEPPRWSAGEEPPVARERAFRRRWDDRRWEDAAAFLQEYSPRRWAAYEALPEGQKERVRSAILRRYTRIERIREHSPEDVYELLIHRIELEDQAWGLGQAIRDTEDPEVRQSLRTQLEAVVTQMVEEQFLERAERIERLKKALLREENRLAEDRRNTPQRVEEQIERIIATDDPMIDPAPPEAVGERDGAPADPALDPAPPADAPRDRERRRPRLDSDQPK